MWVAAGLGCVAVIVLIISVIITYKKVKRRKVYDCSKHLHFQTSPLKLEGEIKETSCLEMRKKIIRIFFLLFTVFIEEICPTATEDQEVLPVWKVNVLNIYYIYKKKKPSSLLQ